MQVQTGSKADTETGNDINYARSVLRLRLKYINHAERPNPRTPPKYTEAVVAIENNSAS